MIRRLYKISAFALSAVFIAFTVFAVFSGIYIDPPRRAFAESIPAAETDVLLEVSGGDFSYEFVAGPAPYYRVTGLSETWKTANPGSREDPPKLKLVFPASFDDGVNGLMNVQRIGESAFRCDPEMINGDKYILDYSIAALDFMGATNLRRIESCAFMYNDIEALDISGSSISAIADRAFMNCRSLRSVNFQDCLSLSTIGYYAFSNTAFEILDLRGASLIFLLIGLNAFYTGEKLKTVYLDSTAPEAAFPASVEVIVLCGTEYITIEELLELYFENDLWPHYPLKLTYETDVTFKDAGGETISTCTKLHNQPLDFVKRDDGLWYRDPGYSLPVPAEKPGNVYFWTAEGAPDKVLPGSAAASPVYRAVWTYALTAHLELPPGFVLYTDRKLEKLTEYVRAQFRDDGYSGPYEVTEGAILSFPDGQKRFTEGDNTVIVSYNGCSVSIAVTAELRPGLPAWSYWLIGAGIGALIGAACFFSYSLYINKKRKAAVAAIAVTTAPVTAFPDTFSKRERDVALALLSGKARKEICGDLYIAEGTLRKHIENIYRKSGCAAQGEFMAKFLSGK